MTRQQHNRRLFLINIILIFLALFRISIADKKSDASRRKYNTTEPADLTFVIISQNTAHHTVSSQQLKKHILFQAALISGRPPQVHIVPADINIPGAWTILQLFTFIQDRTEGTWVVFCLERTKIYLKSLLDILTEHDCSEEKWLGYPLLDRHPTPTHHYAPSSFHYPLSAAGFAITMPLVKRMSHTEYSNRSIISIDAYYEMAEAIYYKTGVRLIPEQRFCVNYKRKCATAPVEMVQCEQVPRDEIFFAIKTFRDNHSTRARILKDTWLKHASQYLFFSDLNDTSLPAINSGIPNTLVGHCQKTVNILKYIRNNPQWKWIILADDDTILSVRGMEETLGCFANEKGPLMIGERYGYGYAYGKGGYDYITGGGGVAMNIEAVRVLSRCDCPSAHMPDDMWLGACAQQNMVKIIHSQAFHQAQPEDYAMEYLEWIKPVSFHKLDPIDPYNIYNYWFKGKDLTRQHHVKLCEHKKSLNLSRDEL